MRLALAIASFVILIVHGIIFYDQFFHKWESYQTSYFQQALSLAKTDAERAAVEGRSPKIEQIIVTSFGETRVDRCSTCHIGIDDPRFRDAGHPLQSHPFSEAMGDRQVEGKWVRRHKFNDFGCTVCHAPREGDIRVPLATTIPLGKIEKKYTISSLIEFLKNPHHARPSGRIRCSVPG